MKKAQSISLNVIIVAAIALLVLVILSVIFMGRMASWTRHSSDCLENGGKCMDRECDRGYSKLPGKVCYDGEEPDEYMVCCTKLNV